MEPRLRAYIGVLLLTVIVLMNIYIAACYYQLDKIELSPFFIGQAATVNKM